MRIIAVVVIVIGAAAVVVVVVPVTLMTLIKSRVFFTQKHI